jgi:hypothetical protein
MDDEMVEPGQLGEVERARVGRVQDRKRPYPCLEGAVEELWAGSGYFFCHVIFPSFTR